MRPPYTFRHKATGVNFSIENRRPIFMVEDILRFSLNHQHLTDPIQDVIHSKHLGAGLMLKSHVIINPEWEIIYHRGNYDDTFLIQ